MSIVYLFKQWLGAKLFCSIFPLPEIEHILRTCCHSLGLISKVFNTLIFALFSDYVSQPKPLTLPVNVLSGL